MGAVALIVAVVAFFAVGYGVIRFGRRAAGHLLDEPSSRVIAHDMPDEVSEPNRAGIAVALAGALLLVIAVFLPHVESQEFFAVEENTLIQGGDGWIFIFLAVLTVAAVYRYSQRPQRTSSVWIVGAAAVVASIFEGTGSRVTLHSASVLAGAQTEHASPAAGVYAAGVGGLLIFVAGLWLAGMTVAGVGPEETTSVKRCPDCAETVLTDARVCKHCGYRFDATEQPTA